MADEAFTKEDWDAAAAERGTETQDPPPELQPAEDSQAVQVEPEVEQPAFAALSPDVQAKLDKFDQMAATMPQLVNELREAKGRIGALQSQWAKAQQSVEAPSQKQVAAAAKDPEKWASLKGDFPEWGEAISEFVEARLGSVTAGATQGPTPAQIEQLVSMRTEASTAVLRKQMNETLVGFKHPTWKEDVKTPEFTTWWKAQKPDVQELAQSQDGVAAIRMLDLYAADRAKPVVAVKEERTQRLAAAASTSRPGSAGVVSKSFDDMTQKEQWEFMARQRKRSSS